MLLLSAGEAVYSPRLYEYVLYLSPEGGEGAYGALLSMPLFVVKIIAGTSGGILLGDWCSVGATAGTLHAPVRHCRIMWLIIGLIAISTPITLYFFRPWLYSQEVRARMSSARLAGEEAAAELEEAHTTRESPVISVQHL